MESTCTSNGSHLTRDKSGCVSVGIEGTYADVGTADLLMIELFTEFVAFDSLSAPVWESLLSDVDEDDEDELIDFATLIGFDFSLDASLTTTAPVFCCCLVCLAAVVSLLELLMIST